MSRLYSIVDAIITKLSGKATLNVVTKSGTTGTSLYSGRYYADVSSATPTGYTYLAAIVTATNNNRFATVQQVWGGTYRIFSSESGVQVTFQIIYYKTGL